MKFSLLFDSFKVLMCVAGEMDIDYDGEDVVNLKKGELVTERLRFDTPDRGNPASVVELVIKLVKQIDAPRNTPPTGIPMNGLPAEREELSVTLGPFRGSTKVTPSITSNCSSLSVA